MPKLRKIPIKNYIVLTIVLIFTFLLTYYCYLWFKTYQEGTKSTAILETHLNSITYDEIESYVNEKQSAIFYTSNQNNNKAILFEKKFRSIINKYDLKETILYVNMTEISKDKLKKQTALRKYNVSGKSIMNLPNFIIFKNGVLSEIYDVAENNYSLDKTEEYLKTNNIISSDQND